MRRIVPARPVHNSARTRVNGGWPASGIGASANLAQSCEAGATASAVSMTGSVCECRSRGASCACPQRASKLVQRGMGDSHNLSAIAAGLWHQQAISVPWAPAPGPAFEVCCQQMRQFRLTGLFIVRCNSRSDHPTAGIPSWQFPAARLSIAAYSVRGTAVAVDENSTALWAYAQGVDNYDSLMIWTALALSAPRARGWVTTEVPPKNASICDHHRGEPQTLNRSAVMRAL